MRMVFYSPVTFDQRSPFVESNRQLYLTFDIQFLRSYFFFFFFFLVRLHAKKLTRCLFFLRVSFSRTIPFSRGSDARGIIKQGYLVFFLFLISPRERGAR